jgi:hypothetical protein
LVIDKALFRAPNFLIGRAAPQSSLLLRPLANNLDTCSRRSCLRKKKVDRLYQLEFDRIRTRMGSDVVHAAQKLLGADASCVERLSPRPSPSRR